MLELIKWAKEVNEKIKNDHVGAYAAQSAYFIILSAVPFIMFLLILLNYLSVDAKGMLEGFLEFLPGESDNFVRLVLDEIEEKTTGAILSFTIITLLWSAGKGIMAITRGLNAVYDSDESRNYVVLRVMAAFYTLVFAIMIIFTLAFLVFGNKLYRWLCGIIPVLTTMAGFVIVIRTIFSLLLLTLFFALFYKVLPNRKSKFSHQFPGALFSATGWMVSSYAFSIYVDYSTNLSYIYGSITGIVLLMLWLYLLMNIMFLGAELNMLIYYWETPDKSLKY